MPFVNTLRSSTSVSFGKRRSAAEALLGNLLAWGVGTRFGIFDTGNLGDGFSQDRSSPVHVGALRTWLTPTAGYYTTMCTKSDGSLWAWGRNNVGQLGLNDTVTRSSPVQVGNVTTWSQPASSGTHTFCTRTDGTLWSWGFNDSGGLGLGDTIRRSSPTQVGNLQTWAKLASNRYGGMAIKTDGTLHFWGVQMSGGMGAAIGTISSPVQIGNSTDWASLAVAQNNGFCVKTNGALFVLGGVNHYGQCGLNATTPDYRSSPVQIGALTTWLTPSTQSYSSTQNGTTICTRIDGTLWAWGRQAQSVFQDGNRGQLGQNDGINRSSPVQIGTKTNWVKPVSGRRYHLCTTT
jgi:alpha-tubulin suppressor-like RCC1 family protein